MSLSLPIGIGLFSLGHAAVQLLLRSVVVFAEMNGVSGRGADWF